MLGLSPDEKRRLRALARRKAESAGPGPRAAAMRLRKAATACAYNWPGRWTQAQMIANARRLATTTPRTEGERAGGREGEIA
jgi:hypothetical protein